MKTLTKLIWGIVVSVVALFSVSMTAAAPADTMPYGAMKRFWFYYQFPPQGWREWYSSGGQWFELSPSGSLTGFAEVERLSVYGADGTVVRRAGDDFEVFIPDACEKQHWLRFRSAANQPWKTLAEAHFTPAADAGLRAFSFQYDYEPKGKHNWRQVDARNWTEQGPNGDVTKFSDQGPLLLNGTSGRVVRRSGDELEVFIPDSSQASTLLRVRWPGSKGWLSLGKMLPAREGAPQQE